MDKVVHFEIPVKDLERAKKFYSSIFGWEMNSVPKMEYTIATTGPTTEDRMPTESGFINGGFLKQKSPVLSPVLIINVEDIETSRNKILKSGGKILKEPSKVGNMGIIAYFQDSEGNILGLWENLPQ